MSKTPLWPVLDDYGLQKIPLRFYALLLLLLRPYLSWVLVLTLPSEQRNMLSLFYPLQREFVLACVVAAPLLLLVAALSQRKPKGSAFWRPVWRRGRVLLLLVAITDFVIGITHLPANVMLDAPFRVLSPLLLLIGIGWLLGSRTLAMVFSEWPEPKKAPETDNAAKPE